MPLGNFPSHPVRHILAFKAHSLATIGKFFFPSDIEILAFIAVDFIRSLLLHGFRLLLANLLLSNDVSTTTPKNLIVRFVRCRRDEKKTDLFDNKCTRRSQRSVAAVCRLEKEARR